MLAPGAENFELKKTTGFPVRSLQEENGPAVKNDRDLKKGQEFITVSDSHQKTLTDKFPSLTEEQSFIQIKRKILCADLDERTALVQQTIDEVQKALFKVFKGV